MLVFFFPFFENPGSYVYNSMRARVRVIVFERHQRSDFFVEKLLKSFSHCTCACPRCARGRQRRRLLLSRPLGGSAAKWTTVVWPIKSRTTNQQTNKHTLLFYRYRRADQGRLRPKIKYEVSCLPIVFLKMRYENVKLQMIPWGPANSICEEYDSIRFKK